MTPNGWVENDGSQKGYLPAEDVQAVYDSIRLATAKGIIVAEAAGNGQMDLDLMKQVAPLAATRTYNNRYYFSSRINPKSLVYQGIYQDFSIGAMALK